MRESDKQVTILGFRHRHPAGWHSGSGYVGPSHVIARVQLDYLKSKPVVEVKLGDLDAHLLLDELAKAITIQARNRAHNPNKETS